MEADRSLFQTHLRELVKNAGLGEWGQGYLPG